MSGRCSPAVIDAVKLLAVLRSGDAVVSYPSDNTSANFQTTFKEIQVQIFHEEGRGASMVISSFFTG